MNKVNEVLNVEKAVCREFDIPEIVGFIKQHGFIPMSWGFNSPTIVKKNKCFRFSVNGYHHKGFVYIVLNFMDTFTVFYTDKKDVIKKVSDEVYIMELIETLDENIEKIPEYKF